MSWVLRVAVYQSALTCRREFSTQHVSAWQWGIHLNYQHEPHHPVLISSHHFVLGSSSLPETATSHLLRWSIADHDIHNPMTLFLQCKLILHVIDFRLDAVQGWRR
jgi:hypothetical protein